MALLVVLITLAVICGPACGAGGCSGFRHLDNGQTFFRYGGLLVIFHCNPGYKLHGYKTNSCVSGHWSRELPVCVGSSCPHPGLLTHGTSNMNEDGSWVVFSCNTGFHLRGPSMLFCKGHIWNGTKPVCRESDIMSSVSIFSLGKSKIDQNLQLSTALKSQQLSQLDALPNRAFKEEDIKSELLSQTLNSETIRETKPKTDLKKQIQFDKDGIETAQETKRNGSEVQSQQEEAETVDETAQIMSLKNYLSSTVSSGMSVDPGTTSKPSPSASHKLSVTTFSDISLRQTSHHDISFASFTIGHQVPVISQDNLSDKIAAENKNLQAETGFQSSFLHHSHPADKDNKQSYVQVSASNTAFTDSNSTQSNISSSITLSPNTSTLDLTTLWDDFYNFTLNTTSEPFLTISRRPLCPYPPVPTHGTFYFRNVENPGPSEFRHYIQYSCYPGYTLAHGDTHSYCTPGGTWSGNTPVCLELTPCSVNNGGCSQLCSYSQNYNRTSDHTRTQCHCRPGFVLLDDGQTCRDLDECVEEQQRCHHGCINTFGSFKCSCNVGYQPAPDQTSCSDVDECLLPAAVSGCMFGCINTPGSFHCWCPDGYGQLTADGQCRDLDECAANEGLGPCMQRCHNLPGSYRCSCMYGHTLAGDGHRCIAECPTGYRKQPNAPSEDSTKHSLKKECVDINECLEEMCEWRCVNLPGSYRCICPRGYTLQRDGRSCKDINECNQKNGGCSHVCVNRRGGYKCSCPASLRLSPYNWKKCFPKTTSTAG